MVRLLTITTVSWMVPSTSCRVITSLTSSAPCVVLRILTPSWYLERTCTLLFDTCTSYLLSLHTNTYTQTWCPEPRYVLHTDTLHDAWSLFILTSARTWCTKPTRTLLSDTCIWHLVSLLTDTYRAHETNTYVTFRHFD